MYANFQVQSIYKPQIQPFCKLIDKQLGFIVDSYSSRKHQWNSEYSSGNIQFLTDKHPEANRCLLHQRDKEYQKDRILQKLILQTNYQSQYFRQEHRADFMKANPEKSLTDATKELQLPDKQKKAYEIEAKKENDAWDKDGEVGKYGGKFKEGQKVLKNQHKYHSQGRQKGFQYQEILSAKQKRKLLPLGDDDTKPVGGRGRGRQKSEKSKEDSNNRQSQFRGGNSRSPSSNPKAQQEHKDQQPAGRGKQKKQ
ncbi:hypothetical protein pb186bvf_020397 [Paramecium bursaria]